MVRNYYPLAALTKNRQDLVSFTLEDGVCPISEDYFVLLNRPGTPILQYNTIVRGMDIEGVFEGDIISYRRKDYMIKYQRGFNAQALDGSIIDIPEDEFTVKTHMYFQRVFKWLDLTGIRYKIQDSYHTINSFYGFKQGSIIVSNRSIKYAKPEIVQQYAGISIDNKKAYFGKNDFGNVYLEHGKLKIERV